MANFPSFSISRNTSALFASCDVCDDGCIQGSRPHGLEPNQPPGYCDPSFYFKLSELGSQLSWGMLIKRGGIQAILFLPSNYLPRI